LTEFLCGKDGVGFELRVSYWLGRCSTTEPKP
jgi:hypothetical protein